ncbi:MAG: hypothetical protein KME42_14210 [Tildeniella nuda ZEHNDER 1965/U140]|jgi:hypothetical protein|nr:hypothetical protein [Tildeniella nuda ZEHNDER 1965/U140]
MAVSIPVKATRLHQDDLGGLVKVQYDFAVHGGAIGAIAIPLLLPNKAVIFDGFMDVVTAPTSSGSATIAAGFNTTTDIKAATAIASYTGIVAVVPVGTAAAALKLTADRQLTLTVAVAALTAGKINFFFKYFISE